MSVARRRLVTPATLSTVSYSPILGEISLLSPLSFLILRVQKESVSITSQCTPRVSVLQLPPPRLVYSSRFISRGGFVSTRQRRMKFILDNLLSTETRAFFFQGVCLTIEIYRDYSRAVRVFFERDTFKATVRRYIISRNDFTRIRNFSKLKRRWVNFIRFEIVFGMEFLAK